MQLLPLPLPLPPPPASVGAHICLARARGVVARFAKDMDAIDAQLPDYLIQLLQNTCYFVSAAVMCSVATPHFMLVLPLLLVLFFLMASYMRRSYRQVKRIEGVSRSPIFSAFAQLLEGLPTLRAFGVQQDFIAAHTRRVDLHNGNFLTYWLAGNWFALRVDSIGAMIVAAVAIFAAVLPQASSSTAMVGLALAFAVQFTSLLQWTVRVFCETETNLTSVERLNHYTSSIPTERGHGTTLAAAEWPSAGEVVFTSVSMRYVLWSTSGGGPTATTPDRASAVPLLALQRADVLRTRRRRDPLPLTNVNERTGAAAAPTPPAARLRLGRSLLGRVLRVSPPGTAPGCRWCSRA